MRKRFGLKVFGVIISMMLALCQPMMVYALEEIEDTGAPASEQVFVLEVVVQEDISSDEPVEGSEVVVSEGADLDNSIEEVPGVPEGQNQLENIVSEESNPEDEITAGLGNSSEENVPAETLEFPYAHISEEGDDVVDAEKYSLFVEGYDSLLCWAATTSNMLWIAGYAQNAINPLTGEPFKSEDEVFDYYRTCFTDSGGYEADGISYFINGEYNIQGIPDISQLKDDAPKGGFFPTLNFDNIVVDAVQDQESGIDVLEIYDILHDEYEGAAGLGIYFWNVPEEKAVGGHAITLLAIEKDENGNYLGIWVVDSDDSTPFNDGLIAETPGERAALAANAPNIRQYYTISYEEVDGENVWVINGFTALSSYKTLILTLTYLRQYNPDWFKPSEGASSSSISVEAYDAIKEMMIEEGWAVFSPTDSVYDSANDTGYSVFVCRLANDLLNVYIDGNRLSFGSGEYKIYKSKNGIVTLTFGTEVMRGLEAGEHTITLDFGNGEDVETTVTVK
ncbi:MAG: hypothetical protein J6Y02_17575 [Pseudobutyrivibrio sp.]|nr:hypothetical protein [Pseudobutyrivibrio sp.]